MAIPGIVPILPLGTQSLITPISSDNTPKVALGDGAQKAGADFSQFLNDALKQVDTLQKDADAASIGLATGQVQDVHSAMVALEKANLSLSLTVQVRDKVLDAYHEMMRMQL